PLCFVCLLPQGWERKKSRGQSSHGCCPPAERAHPVSEAAYPCAFAPIDADKAIIQHPNSDKRAQQRGGNNARVLRIVSIFHGAPPPRNDAAGLRVPDQGSARC